MAIQCQILYLCDLIVSDVVYLWPVFHFCGHTVSCVVSMWLYCVRCSIYVTLLCQMLYHVAFLCQMLYLCYLIFVIQVSNVCDNWSICCKDIRILLLSHTMLLLLLYVSYGRTPLPDIPLTPREQQILVQTSMLDGCFDNNADRSRLHGKDGEDCDVFLFDVAHTERAVLASPPPKPPLPYHSNSVLPRWVQWLSSEIFNVRWMDVEVVCLSCSAMWDMLHNDQRVCLCRCTVSDDI